MQRHTRSCLLGGPVDYNGAGQGSPNIRPLRVSTRHMTVTRLPLSRMRLNSVRIFQFTRPMSGLLKSGTCLALTILTILAGADVCGETKPGPDVKATVSQHFAAGVIDAAGQIGYVDIEGGKIAAIELASGQELWKSQAAMWPLIGVGDELLVLVRSQKDLIVQWREPATGKRLRDSDPIALPAWTTRPIHLSPRCGVLEGQLLLEWLIVEDTGGGIPPLTGSGQVKVELASGQVSAAPFPPTVQLQTLAPKQHQSLGALTFSIVQTMEELQPRFVTYKRTLRAVDATGKQVWERPLPTFTVGPPKP